MAAGEYISVASQKDTEEADVEKEREQQEGSAETREHELEELTQIYVARGLEYNLAREVTSSRAQPLQLHPWTNVHGTILLLNLIWRHTLVNYCVGGRCSPQGPDYGTCKFIGEQLVHDDEVCGLQVAVALSRTKESAVEAHARDELGIDLDDLANPFQVRSRMAPLDVYTAHCRSSGHMTMGFFDV